MTAQQLSELSEQDFITKFWGTSVLEVINRQHTTTMSMEDFLTHCTQCGGDWGGMLLSGIQALYPEVYHAIPDDMGIFAWRCICDTITLLGIKSEEV